VPAATAYGAWVGASAVSGQVLRVAGRVIGVALAVCVFAGCGRSQTRPPAPATRVVSVTPESATDTLKPGYSVGFHRAGVTCEGSEVLPGDYRCGGSLGVFDPCWADATTTLPAVSCLFQPWSHDVFRLELTQPLGAPNATGTAVYVWGMQLSSGQRCLAFQGAHGSFDGQPINYYCPSDPALSLLGRPDARHPTWRIRELNSDARGDQRYGPSVAIAIAWFGLPSPLPPSAGATSATQPTVGVT
jgi:hypothetical protein